MNKEEIEKAAENYTLIVNGWEHDITYDAFIAGAKSRQVEIEKLKTGPYDLGFLRGRIEGIRLGFEAALENDRHFIDHPEWHNTRKYQKVEDFLFVLMEKKP